MRILFRIDKESLANTLSRHVRCLQPHFTRLGLNFRAVQADTGSISGFASHEFHVLADSGEDDIAFSSDSDFAANIELAEAVCYDKRAAPTQARTDVDTPNMTTCEAVAEHLNIPLSQTVKTLIVKGRHSQDNPEAPKFIALVLRGDHTLNEIKAEKIADAHTPLTMATEDELKRNWTLSKAISVPICSCLFMSIVRRRHYLTLCQVQILNTNIPQA